MDCLFCKIVKGEIPAYKIYEDDLVLAFLDIHPKENGHTLIIPKKHYTDFTELDEAMIIHIHQVAKKIVELLKNKLNASGFCLNTNYLDTQEIKHYHMHIVPITHSKIQNVEEIYKQLKN